MLTLTTSTSHMQSCFKIDVIFIKLSNVSFVCLKARVFYDCHEMADIWARIEAFDQLFMIPTVQTCRYRYMYLKKAWYLKTYIDVDSSINFEKLH